jgi:hypothetical protein
VKRIRCQIERFGKVIESEVSRFYPVVAGENFSENGAGTWSELNEVA